MRFAPCSYSRRKASQKLVTPKTPVQPLSTCLRLAGSSKSAFTTSAPSCLNVFAASESGCRVRQSTSALPSFTRRRATAPPCRPVAPVTRILSAIDNSLRVKRSHGLVSGRCRHFSVSPAALRFEDPQETALLLAYAPRTRSIGGPERNDARSGSSLAQELAMLRRQA